LEKELQDKRNVLFYLSETIKALDPTVRLDALPVRQRRGTASLYLAHGDLTAFVCDEYRESRDHTLTSKGVALRIMRERGLDPSDHVKFKDFEVRVRVKLNALRCLDKAEKLEGRGEDARWRLNPPGHLS
jgi:hypothetical protein